MNKDQLHLGEGLVEALDGPGEKDAGAGGVQAHPQLAAALLLDVPELAVQALLQHTDLTQGGQKGLSRRGQGEFGPPGEKLGAVRFLQPLHLFAHGLLAHIQPLGRPADALLLGQDEKIFHSGGQSAPSPFPHRTTSGPSYTRVIL